MTRLRHLGAVYMRNICAAIEEVGTDRLRVMLHDDVFDILEIFGPCTAAKVRNELVVRGWADITTTIVSRHLLAPMGLSGDIGYWPIGTHCDGYRSARWSLEINPLQNDEIYRRNREGW